jgi:regulatory protein
MLMIITDLKQQEKNQRRYSLFVDGRFAYGLSDVDVAFYGLKVGDELTEEKYNLILNEAVYAKAKQKAVSLICYRERSEKEIKDKISRDYSEEITQRVMDFLREYGYTDDRKFAAAYAKDSLHSKKWGRRKIEFELKMKGVAPDVIESVLDEVIEGEERSQAELASVLLEKRLKGRTSVDYKEKRKQTAYLAGRGFSFDDINDAFSLLEIEVVRDY